MNNFYEELPRMLKHFADFNELETIDELKEKSEVLPLGLDLQRFDAHKQETHNEVPLILWNHRWEADKNPQAFFSALYQLADDGFNFNLALVGENFRQKPKEFEKARDYFGEAVLHYGFAESFSDYARLLWQSDYVISTSYQDFFGISVAEAIYCNCIPILANRLNYPHLIPENFHKACLFRDGTLYGHLKQHLQGHHSLDTASLQKYIAQYDWSHMASIYDSTFTAMI